MYCQGMSGTLNGNAQLAVGYTYNDTLGIAVYQNFNVEMRALPSVTASGDFIFNDSSFVGLLGLITGSLALLVLVR